MSDDQDVVCTLWVIYEHPSDFPDHFVVRRHFVLRPGGIVSPDFAWRTIRTGNPYVAVDRMASLAPTLDEARALLPPGLFRTDRHPEDDPKIVEVWI